MFPSVTTKRAERSQIQTQCPYSQFWTHSPHKPICCSFNPLLLWGSTPLPSLTLQYSFWVKPLSLHSKFVYLPFFLRVVSSFPPPLLQKKTWKDDENWPIPFEPGRTFLMNNRLFSGQSSLTKQGGLNNFDHEFLKEFWGLNFCYWLQLIW